MSSQITESVLHRVIFSPTAIVGPWSSQARGYGHLQWGNDWRPGGRSGLSILHPWGLSHGLLPPLYPCAVLHLSFISPCLRSDEKEDPRRQPDSAPDPAPIWDWVVGRQAKG